MGHWQRLVRSVHKPQRLRLRPKKGEYLGYGVDATMKNELFFSVVLGKTGELREELDRNLSEKRSASCMDSF